MYSLQSKGEVELSGFEDSIHGNGTGLSGANTWKVSNKVSRHSVPLSLEFNWLRVKKDP